MRGEKRNGILKIEYDSGIYPRKRRGEKKKKKKRE